MKIDERHYLFLMRKAVADTLMPELSSDEARRVGKIVLGGFDELLRREQLAPQLLNHMSAGVALAHRVQACLGTIGGDEDQATRALLVKINGRFEDHTVNSGHYQELLAVLERLVGTALVRAPETASGTLALRALIEEISQWESSFEQALLEPVAVPMAADEAVSLSLQHLQTFVRQNATPGGNIKINEFARIPGGMSKHTFRFNLQDDASATEALIVRQAPSKPLVGIGTFVLRREYQLVKALHRVGYSVPEPLWFYDNERAGEGDYYVMKKVEGSSSGSLFVMDSPVPESVLLEMAEALARLHGLELGRFEQYIRVNDDPEILHSTIEDQVRRYIGAWFDTLRSAARQPSPAEMYNFAWLLANVPENKGRPVLVHGDYTPHNCLWNSQHLTAVVDWEAAHFGDPAEDLAYVRPHISSRMDWGKFLGHYRASGGPPVREGDFNYYDCFFYTRLCLLCNVMTNRVQNLGSQDVTLLHIDYEFRRRFLTTSVNAVHAAGATMPSTMPP